MRIQVVDRRSEPSEDKFGVSRKRFIERSREIIKKAVNEKVAQGSMKDFEKGGISVPIPPETIKEPTIHHGASGDARYVFPGLAKFDVGDRIPKPKTGGGQGSGQGSGAAQKSDGEDDFIWISPEELLDILFDGRELPDMTKFKDYETSVTERDHAGHTNKGPSQKMDLEFTNRKRIGEAMILSKLGEKRVIGNLVEQFNIYAGYHGDVSPLALTGGKVDQENRVSESLVSLKSIFAGRVPSASSPEGQKIPALLVEAVGILRENLRSDITKPEDIERLSILEQRLPEQMKARDRAANFRPDHMTYKYDDDIPKPAAKAVLFCKMDVSWSMDQERKNTAKSFFWLVNKFLSAKYDRVDIVFISHTETAKEVNEEDFFYSKETGGTIVSSCLVKTKEIISSRYPPDEWNIYGVQASDGENPTDDNQKVKDLMNELLPVFQAYYYIQVAEPHFELYDPLLPMYQDIAEGFPRKLFTALIKNPAEALDAFRTLFPVGGHHDSTPKTYAPA